MIPILRLNFGVCPGGRDIIEPGEHNYEGGRIERVAIELEWRLVFTGDTLSCNHELKRLVAVVLRVSESIILGA